MEFNPEDADKGVFALSLVSEPAMESEWVALKKQDYIQLKAIDEKELLGRSDCLLRHMLILYR